MGYIDLAIALVSIAVFLVARSRLPRQILMPDGIFLGVVLFFAGAYGGAAELHYMPGADRVLHLATLCLASAALGSIFLPLIYRDLPTMLAPPRPVNRHLIYAIGAVLLLFTSGFSYLVFTKLLNGNWSTLSNEGGLLGIRKLIASGEKGYFFPGLVKQMRDVLGPSFVFYLLAYTRRGQFRWLTLAVLGSTLLAVFLGGQRTPLLVIAWVVFEGRRASSTLGTGKAQPRMTLSRVAGYMFVLLPALCGVNVLLGRIDLTAGLSNTVFNTLYGLYERLVLVVPLASIETFQFVMTREIGLGELWIADIANLAPGTQTGFSNQLHSYLGGSMAGNAVLGMPVNAYFNAGLIGVVLFPITVMFAAAILDRWVARIRDPYLSSARCVMVAFMPICYDPAIFLLSGGLFFLAVLGAVVFMEHLKSKRRAQRAVIHPQAAQGQGLGHGLPN